MLIIISLSFHKATCVNILMKHLKTLAQIDSNLDNNNFQKAGRVNEQSNLWRKPTESAYTPWKINMEPTNHQFRKENDLPNLHDYGPC